jgi:hypothetical protein
MLFSICEPNNQYYNHHHQHHQLGATAKRTISIIMAGNKNTVDVHCGTSTTSGMMENTRTDKQLGFFFK